MLQLAKLAIACAGYRVSAGPAQHRTTFQAVRIVLDKNTDALISYFDICRRKRNRIDYDQAEVASETEVEDLLVKTREFQDLVEGWVRRNHPEFGI